MQTSPGTAISVVETLQLLLFYHWLDLWVIDRGFWCFIFDCSFGVNYLSPVMKLNIAAVSVYTSRSRFGRENCKKNDFIKILLYFIIKYSYITKNCMENKLFVN